MAKITADQVERAAEAFRAVKARRNVSESEKSDAAERFAALRSAFREQEEAAGRRGLVGGDAVRES